MQDIRLDGAVKAWIELEAKEITCRAKGDKECRFVMAHSSKLEKYVKENLQKFAK